MLKKMIPFAMLAAGLAGSAAYAAGTTNYVTIGTGGITGVYYPAGGAIAKVVNEQQKVHHVRASVESTGGSKFNINAISSGDLDFGFAQADTQYQAFNGVGPWEGKPVKKLRAVFSLESEAVTFVAAEDANIKSVRDVKGHIINLGDAGSGNRLNALDIFKQVGLVPGKDFQDEKLKPADAPHLLQDGRLDGFFYTVGHPNGNIKEATAGKRKVRIVSIPESDLGSLLKDAPYYAMTTIDMSQYPEAANAKDGDVTTLGMLATIVTSADTPDSVVYTFTKEVMENLDTLKGLHPALAGLTQKGMLEGLTAPIHPGALKYYKEKGLIK